MVMARDKKLSKPTSNGTRMATQIAPSKMAFANEACTTAPTTRIHEHFPQPVPCPIGGVELRSEFITTRSSPVLPTFPFVSRAPSP